MAKLLIINNFKLKIMTTNFYCHTCGEEYASLPENITDINNGVELWLEQELKSHQLFCRGDEETQEWISKVNKKFGNRTLTKEEYKESYSEHRAHAWGRGEGAHFPCLHYMLAQKASKKIARGSRR